MKTYLSSFSAVFTAALLLSAAPSRAQDVIVRDTPPGAPGFSKSEQDYAKTDPKYFTIDRNSVTLKLLSFTEEPDMSYVKLQEQPPKDLGGILVSIDQIVNIASKIWDIVQQNQPVVNIDTKYATAYPMGVTSASQLSQWSRPKTFTYGFYAKNLYGSVMIDCKYKFSFSYNGAYKGKGKYLTGVAVIPTVAQVGWGYQFYMTAAVPDSTITNVGTDTDPIAGMQMKLNWKMHTVLKEMDGTSIYYIQGDGYFEEIANPWKQAVKMEDVKSAAPLLAPEKLF